MMIDRSRLSARAGSKGWMQLAHRTDVELALRRLAPRIPEHELGAVVDHAMDSAGLRSAAPEAAAWLSLTAYVRHVLTEYDALLEQGYDPDSARFFVVDEMDEILAGWGVRRRLADEPGPVSGSP
jgi:hypothetical protein